MAAKIELIRQPRDEDVINEQQHTIKMLQESQILLRQENAELKVIIQQLRDEIAILKGIKPRPKIEPSILADDKKDEDEASGKKPPVKRPGSNKRSKTANLKIHETKKMRPDNLPPGSYFKGYREFTVQDILITPHNTLYRLERWETPEGNPFEAQLPSDVKGHFGSSLKSYIIYQYHQCHVTEPLILEQLREFGIDISSGEINNILTENKDVFHKEKDGLLPAGLSSSLYVHTDDTGARHNGKNGVCTVIGNQWFTWFKSTRSKSRINFLKLLRGGEKDYVLNAEAMEYIAANNISLKPRLALKEGMGEVFNTRNDWKHYLASIGVSGMREVRIATEGALIGSLVNHGFSREIIILSDDAGQFEIKTILHALCWFHAERNIKKIFTGSDEQRTDVAKVRDQIWNFYRELKYYCSECQKNGEHYVWKVYLDMQFDAIFKDRTCYFATLNQALRQIYKNKKELLMALDHPDLPLHNNGSERDIREYVKRRKVSGSTRSRLGRQARDTFTSLKKTCRKLGISFWEYLNDRVAGTEKVPNLGQLVQNKTTVPE